MKVILLQELKGKGGEGDVVDVAKGFANNFLFPQKMAVAATQGNLKQLEQRKKNIARREAIRLGDAEKIKELLEDVVVKVAAKVGEEGQLFGSVTAQMIADGLNQATGLEVDKKRIDLKAPIKTAGEHEVSLSLYREVKTSVKVLVYDESQEAPAVEEATEAAEASGDMAAPEEADASGNAPVAEGSEEPKAADDAYSGTIAEAVQGTQEAVEAVVEKADAEPSAVLEETVEVKEEQ